MLKAVFLDNDQSSLVLFEELCRQYQIYYTGIQKSDQLEQYISQLASADIIIVDLEMPKRNGFDVLQWIRSHPTLKSIPVVACTVYTDQMEHTRDSGFSSFMVKPLNVNRFFEQVQKIIQGQPIWETHSD